MMARLSSLVLADDRAAKPFASQASDLLLPFREEIPASCAYVEQSLYLNPVK
jgi:hypothetical protein